MSVLESAAQRRERLAREAQLATEARARLVLQEVGWSANSWVIGDGVRRRFRRLTAEGVAAVVEMAERLQQDSRAKREAKVALAETTKASRAGIRELLKERQDLTASQMYHVLRERGVNLCAKSSFNNHVSEIRKELGIDVHRARNSTPAEDVNTAAAADDPPPEVLEKPEQDPHTPGLVDQLLDEIQSTEARLTKLRTALEVVEEMQGGHA